MNDETTGQPDAGSVLVIAIDGPSGTGKSSVARAVAHRLGASYLDTGAMYRALTVSVLALAIAPEDADSIASLADRVQLTVATDPGAERVTVDGRDVTEAIRAAQVDAAVSAVSAVPAVRRQMVDAQRRLADAIAGSEARSTMVVEGRDIGTVVFPAARLKIYLTAAPAARAARRAEQLGVVDPGEIDALAESLRARDEFDSTRAESPLRPADDAIVLDSTDLSQDEVVEAILAAVTARSGSE